MKKLSGLAAAALVCGSLVSGCGGSSSTNIAAIEQAMANCSQASMASMLRALYAIVGVPDFIAGEGTLPGFDISALPSTDPLDPPNTWDFAVVFDTNSNGIPDSAIVGKITFSEDPTDGLDPGAVLNITFTIQNTPVVAGGAVENGTVTGSGDLTATLGVLTTQVDITGTITLTDTANGGCLVDLTFPLATPLHLDFGGLATQLAANVVIFEFYGTIQMILETLGHMLDAR